jgi:hypothetical protein
MSLGRVDEKQPIETKAAESLKEIGRRLARFPLKVDLKVEVIAPCVFQEAMV